jgi:hypothetical protein
MAKHDISVTMGGNIADFAKAMVAESQRWATVVNNRKLAGTN